MPTSKPELYIEDVGVGKRVALNTKVYVIHRADDGTETGRTDISMLVRAIDMNIKVGNVLTCNLECFLTSVNATATLDTLTLTEFKPKRRPWRTRLRDATTFGSRLNIREYV